jgi:hypothetical protein
MNEKPKSFWKILVIILWIVSNVLFFIGGYYLNFAYAKTDYTANLNTLKSDNQSIREQLEKQRSIIEFLDTTNKQFADDNRKAIKNLESARGTITSLTTENQKLTNLNQEAAAKFRKALTTLETIRENQESDIAAITELRQCNQEIADAIAGD